MLVLYKISILIVTRARIAFESSYLASSHNLEPDILVTRILFGIMTTASRTVTLPDTYYTLTAFLHPGSEISLDADDMPLCGL